MTKNIFTKLLSLALITACTFSACKKDRVIESAAQAMLIGSWTETPQVYHLNTIYFGNNGSFTMHTVFFNAIASASTYNGTYKVDGNKLIVNVTEIVTKEPNQAPVTTKISYTMFDKATFTLQDNTLLLDYFTYPADGPVPTHSKFLKN